MVAKTVPPVPTGPLTPEHHRELALAQERGAKIRRAASVANFNGWITAIIAASSLLFLLFSFGVVHLLVTAGLAVVAYNEFRGRDRLLAYDPSAATLLGWNQLGLLALITAYCCWQIGQSLFAPLPISADVQGLMRDSGIDAGPFRYLAAAFYGLIIVLSVIFQGLNALYYFSRRKHLEEYVRDTPEWIRDVQRTTASV